MDAPFDAEFGIALPTSLKLSMARHVDGQLVDERNVYPGDKLKGTWISAKPEVTTR